MATPVLTNEEKIELIAQAYTKVIEDYCRANRLNLRHMADKLLSRKSAVRVAKVANFRISGTPVNIILADDESIYHCTNRIYGLIRDWTEVSIEEIKDDALLAQLQS